MRFLSNALRAVATIFLGSALFMSAQTALAMDDQLKVTKAWIRMAPATLKTHGAYMTITNGGPKAKDLVAASSPNYKDVQLHVSRVVDGIATMEHLESVEIPAGGKAEFKPGGLHLMLMQANKPLEEGGMVPLKLTFRSGETVNVEAMVMKRAPGGASDMKEMDHSGHNGHKTH